MDRSSPFWIFKLKTSGLFLEHFGLDFINYIRVLSNGQFWKTLNPNPVGKNFKPKSSGPF